MTKERKEIRKALRTVFEKHKDDIAFAYLFGSVANLQADDLSDIDLAVFVRHPDEFSFDKKMKLHGDCCRALGRDDIDLVVLNQTRNLILQDEIIRTGHLLWDQDEELRIDYELRICHLAIDFRHQRFMEMGI